MKFSAFTLRFAVVFAILALLLTLFAGCDSKKDLDRDKAEKIIKEFYGFPQVYRGNFRYDRINEYRDKVYPNLQKLESAGLITIESYTHWTQQRYHIAHPTSMADMYKVEDVKFSFQGEKSAWYVAYVAEVKEVTGIVFNAEKTEAEVEYLIAYTKTTPFGEFLMGDKYDEYTKEGKKVKVKMKLYDDGWRVSDDPAYAVSKDVLEGGYEKYKGIFDGKGSQGGGTASVFKEHSTGKFTITLPTSFELVKTYPDDVNSFNDDYEVFLSDKTQIIELHILSNSKFETTSIKELYNKALNSSDLKISLKVQKDNWFTISGIDPDGNIVYWRRIVGTNFIGDCRFKYSPSKKDLIEPYIGKITKSFIPA